MATAIATENFASYLKTLRTPYIKICRLRFLQPDGSTAFMVDNDPLNQYSTAFISGGNIDVNLQNGQRRTASITLSNVDHRFDYNLNNIWFGDEIALDEGLILPDGTEYYIPQGVFLADEPSETLNPAERTMEYNLVDKWANLDGTLFGNLDGTYEVAVGTNIFNPIVSILQLDRGNGRPVDGITPIITDYYNRMTQALPSGGTVSMVLTPYTLRIDADNGTYADVILGLTGMLNAWVGYDARGALNIEASQDDILDTAKPIQWQFSLDETEILGATYTIKNSEVYNDYIVVGEEMDNYTQPRGRATNYDPRSDTAADKIGKKTIRVSMQGYGTDTQCQGYAAWSLKRATALQSEVSISCKQMFHLSENNLVTIVRTDKENAPTERHLIMGFSRPLTGTENMTITAVSVNDFITPTIMTA